MRVWVVLAVLVAAVWAAQPAAAISRTKANQIALKALAPQSQSGNVVVFGLPSPLKPTDAVFEGGTPTATNKAFTLAAKPLGKKAWLYWEDLAYGARFQHPSRLLLIDDRTGKVLSSKALSWYPLVNSAAPAFVGSAYQADTYKVYSSVRTHRVAVAWTPAWLTATPSNQLPPNAFKNDCLIMIGLRRDPQFAADFQGMIAAAQAYGIGAYKVNTGTAGVDPNGQDLANAVKQVVKDPINCKDVMIYIDGHGYETGPTGVDVGTRTTPAGRDARGRELVRVRPAVVTSDDLIQILKDNAQTTFKIVIDACFSGRFLLDIPPQDHANLLVMTTASKADTYSYSFLKSTNVNGTVVVNNTNNPGVNGPDGTGRGEFTNGFLAGMSQFANSSTAVADAQAAGGSFLGQMIKFAFNNEKGNDFAATNGLTNPLEQDRLPSKPPPPPPPPTPFNVTVQGWYQHFSGFSHDCFSISTLPPQPSASFMSHLDGGMVMGSRDMTGFLGADGRTTITYPILQYGLYTEMVTIVSGIQTRSGSTTLDVTASPGTAPCP